LTAKSIAKEARRPLQLQIFATNFATCKTTAELERVESASAAPRATPRGVRDEEDFSVASRL